MYIVIEGPDGSGKTTQIKYASKLLKECVGEDNLVEVKEPGSTHLGEDLRHILLRADYNVNSTEELLMFYAARSSLHREVISPAIGRQKVVLSDRNYISSFVYQCQDTDVIDSMNELTCIRKPDLLIIVYADVHTCADRMRSGGQLDRIENVAMEELSKRVSLYRKYQWIGDQCRPGGTVTSIDSSDLSEIQVAERIRGLLDSQLREKGLIE